MYTDSKDQTAIYSTITSIFGNKYSEMSKLTISLNGITKLIQISKTSGHDHQARQRGGLGG